MPKKLNPRPRTPAPASFSRGGSPKLIVGLGNPGLRYRHTYHNAGLLALDHLAKITDAAQFQPITSRGFSYVRVRETILIRPLVLMNRAGDAVAAAMRHFRVKPEETLVMHDDADLMVGEYRFAFGRGAAGHHGVESIVARIGTTHFSRLRIGIRTDAALPRKKAGEFVLRKISGADMKTLYGVFGAAIENIKEKESP
ncbi:MAG: hypothetical protein A3A43_01725 [Candidatus Liptonbacteria bacterium RIFCSPLOWO2_01_FULL_56_20]|uniref:Aminoacyl-tRNA hydrolase n=1 Tax=Candidatus Liptonbacteria bacterium RIFCSPLOWO2_01_FULL_56_20 TaxID=1798652 RepID=A0A1G2CK25_9BACT|nr:MAG: hypothetical protein A3A43_01725 [Candidatus Liptonbacteria bacterium RIFCSPLOWO2_01_FULL_56_20]